MISSDENYDEASTLFTPDGRLLQVEYAMKSVKNGSLSIGAQFSGGVLLLAIRPDYSELVEFRSIQRIFQIDTFIACAISGFPADARVLVDFAREEFQLHRLWYDTSLSALELTNNLARYMHLYTRYDGVRPFGTTFLIGGWDDEQARLFQVDPSGVFFQYYATSIGKGSKSFNTYLAKHYKKNLNNDDAMNLVKKAVLRIHKKKIPNYRIEGVLIDKHNGFQPIDTTVFFS